MRLITLCIHAKIGQTLFTPPFVYSHTGLMSLPNVLPQDEIEFVEYEITPKLTEEELQNKSTAGSASVCAHAILARPLRHNRVSVCFCV